MKIEQLKVALNGAVTPKMQKAIKDRIISAINHDPNLEGLVEDMVAKRGNAVHVYTEGLKKAIAAFVTFYKGK
jgi:Asp-tRNA(Asn)/Glu-tRNA(Gln) amidotransferase B subunit